MRELPSAFVKNLGERDVPFVKDSSRALSDRRMDSHANLGSNRWSPAANRSAGFAVYATIIPGSGFWRATSASARRRELEVYISTHEFGD
jgi:hypothetical protein